MSNCNIRVELDREDRVYRVGDHVKCLVHVDVDQAVSCDGLLARVSWYTHGRGNGDSGGNREHILFKGEWQAGSHVYPCEFDLDSGPLSYHGHNINIDWQVEARADIPWAIDPKDSAEFILERGQDCPQLYAEKVQLDRNTLSNGKSLWLFLTIPLIFSGVGAYKVASNWRINDIFDMLFWIALVAVVLTVSFFVVRNSLAQRKLGKVTVSVDPKALNPGELTEVSVSFSPRVMIALNGIMAQLVAKEVAISGSGTNRKTHTHTFHREEFPLIGKIRLEQGRQARYQTKVMVPKNAHHTFIADDNRIQWQVELTIDVDDWPDWRSSHPLLVKI